MLPLPGELMLLKEHAEVVRIDRKLDLLLKILIMIVGCGVSHTDEISFPEVLFGLILTNLVLIEFPC